MKKAILCTVLSLLSISAIAAELDVNSITTQAFNATGMKNRDITVQTKHQVTITNNTDVAKIVNVSYISCPDNYPCNGLIRDVTIEPHKTFTETYNLNKQVRYDWNTTYRLYAYTKIIGSGIDVKKEAVSGIYVF